MFAERGHDAARRRASPWAAGILPILAWGEFVTDQLPATPGSTVAAQFGARLLSGAPAGVALGAAGGSLGTGLGAGLFGVITAVAGMGYAP